MSSARYPTAPAASPVCSSAAYARAPSQSLLSLVLMYERYMTCQGPNCVATPPVTEDGFEDTPRTIVESTSTADTGSSVPEELILTTLPSLYEKLRDLQGLESIRVPNGLLMRHAVKLGEQMIEDEIGKRSFGTSVDDFKRLCRNVAWDYSAGLVLVNCDRARTLIFPAETSYEPQVVGLSESLAWLATSPGSFGLIVKQHAGVVACELFAVVMYEEHGDSHLRRRSERLLQEVSTWV